MKCFSHRDVDAIGFCKYCCKGLCKGCFVENVGGLLSCRGPCEEKVASFDSQPRDNQPRENQPRRGSTKPPIEKPMKPQPMMQPAPVTIPPAMSAPMPAAMPSRMNQPVPMPPPARGPLPPRPELNRPMAPAYAPPEPPPMPSRQPLYLIFQGERYVVEKDEFVIGRSSRSSDLVISNNDISRKHAAIVFMNGKYYIQDNESVNGIEFNGQRITQQQINEGDVYWLASYELRFTYRP
jgi:neural Wiskott-Aldrich syndrome protein